VFNAGAQFPTVDHRAEDEFETTFEVNVLAHCLLLRLSLPKLAQNATFRRHDERSARPQTESDGAERI
jgi:NAD(P)-dependent dehydrogenase (short-subunit alcohol dehydrogenase family)